MGIVRRQTIKSSIYSYVGAFLGFITTGLLLPRLCTTEQNGLLIMLVQLSVLGAQIFSLSTTNLAGKFFPYFRDIQKGHNGLLFLLLLLSTIGCLLSVIVYFIGKETFIHFFASNSPLLTYYYYLLIPLIIFTIYFNTLDAYTRGLFNVSTGILLKEFVQRLVILIFISFLFIKLLNFEQFLFLYVTAICLPAPLLVLYLIYKKSFSITSGRKKMPKKLYRYMFTFGSYSLLTGFAALVVNTIDNTMISKMLGLSDTGIYGRAFIFGTLIAIPGRIMNKVSVALVAEAWKKKDIKYISNLYTKSCLTQLIIGCLLFLGVWSNIHNIMDMLPAEYAEGKYVIFFISLMSLFDMATGANGIIIVSSKYYRFELLSMSILIIICFISNWFLIPIYGISGAALATASTIFIFNLIRVIFLYVKFKMNPFTIHNIKVILITLLTFAVTTLIPTLNNFIIDLIIRSTFILLFFGILIFYSKVSTDINQQIIRILVWFKTSD